MQGAKMPPDQRELPAQLKLEEEDMNFIPFDQTYFIEENKKAMGMLIILFER